MRTLRILALLLALALSLTSLAACKKDDGGPSTPDGDNAISGTPDGEGNGQGGAGNVTKPDADTAECTHSYLTSPEDGSYVCIKCGKVCTHTWEAGTCNTCGAICTNVYYEGDCAVCGSRHPSENPTNTAGVLISYFDADGDRLHFHYAEAEVGDSLSEILCGIYSKSLDEMIETGYFVVNGEEVSDISNVTLEGTTTVEYFSSVTCSHLYLGGACLYCGKPCPHPSWSVGSCSLCHYPCEHAGYTDGICNVCGTECYHYGFWSEGVCTVCAKVCEHYWIDGECNTCKLVCDHSWNANTCTVCGIVCYLHEYLNGECTICDFVCEHSWINGECNICKLVCTHSWNVDTCTVCGIVCYQHEYLNGECTICDFVCEHFGLALVGHCMFCDYVCYHGEWSENGICLNCFYICPHDEWVEGYCTLCNYKCPHAWQEGVCISCSTECNHTFTMGICTICFIDCSKIDGTITVTYEGVEYTVPFAITAEEFVSGTLGMDFDPNHAMGHWYVIFEGEIYYLSPDYNLCNFGTEITLLFDPY